MLGCVNKTNAMGWIAQKDRSGRHRFENAGFAFDTEVKVDLAKLSDQTDQSFGLVSIELVGDKSPVGIGIGNNSLGNVGGEIGLRAGGITGRGNDLSAGNFSI